MVLVGIRAANWPDEFETKVLIEFIQKNYANHSVSEVKLAFEMAVQGGLLDVDANAYENFSCQYFAKIMTAYRKWAAQEHSYKMAVNRSETGLESHEINELIDWSEQWDNAVKQAKNGKLNKQLIATDLYNWLERTNYFLPENPTEEEKGDWIKEKWAVLVECMQKYLFDMKQAVAANEENGVTTPQSIRELIDLMEGVQIDEDGVIVDKFPWRKNEVIMSHLKTMSKQELVYRAAIIESQNL